MNTQKERLETILECKFFMKYIVIRYSFSRRFKHFILRWEGSVILPFEKLATLGTGGCDALTELAAPITASGSFLVGVEAVPDLV